MFPAWVVCTTSPKKKCTEDMRVVHNYIPINRWTVTHSHHLAMPSSSKPTTMKQDHCKWWLSGSCPYGGQCTYIHDPASKGTCLSAWVPSARGRNLEHIEDAIRAKRYSLLHIDKKINKKK